MGEPADLEEAKKRDLYEKCGFRYRSYDLPVSADDWGYGYAPYAAKDETYYGAKAVVDMEWEAYLQHRPREKPPSNSNEPSSDPRKNLVGLALSGGGIRSASYSLGVMQALAKAGWLKKVDYLSTVSGGGYIGSSFTWLLRHTEDESKEKPADDAKDKPAGAAKDKPEDDAKEISEGDKPPHTKTPRFGIDAANFPFRTYPIAEGSPSPNDVDSGKILRYLRQHASYLTPGGGLDWMSLVAVVLRNSVFSLIVYGSVFVLLFLALYGISQLTGVAFVPEPCNQAAFPSCFPADAEPGSTLFKFAGYALIVWAFVAVFYVFSSAGFGENWFFGGGKHTNYTWRYWHEWFWGRWPLIAALCLALLGSIPATYHWLGMQGHPSPAQTFSIKGTPSQAGAWTIEGTISPPVFPAPNATAQAIEPGFWSSIWNSLSQKIAWVSGLISTLVGVGMSLFAYKQSGAPKKRGIPIGLVVVVGSVALIFGVLLLAYHVYFWAGWQLSGLGFAALLVAIVLMARISDINQMSLHRYYRDRLMETFLPNVEDALNVFGVISSGAKLRDSDGAKLWQMCPLYTAPRNKKAPVKQEQQFKQDARHAIGPYHIINANIVLVSSLIPKFRGRGGDNFILTPLCCGSNATGWCETGKQEIRVETTARKRILSFVRRAVQWDYFFPAAHTDSNKPLVSSPFESMTFATAMAISGAAVNPNTGSGGIGVTRQPLLSFLMGILNIRLGYWTANPSPRSEYLGRFKAIDKKRIKYETLRDIRAYAYKLITCPTLFGNTNAISPGMGELFMRQYLDENSHSIQLTDGGHFENLGLYELVRRRLKVIIVCDGAEDLSYSFSCLANAIEKVRSDFGARIIIDASDLEPIIPGRSKKADFESDDDLPASPRGYLIAPIKYAKSDEDDGAFEGTLIYLTTTFFKNLTADMYAYKKAHPEFPDQSTSDQFFDEAQFEAYRELGFQTAHWMMFDAEIQKNHNIKETLQNPDISCPEKWRWKAKS